MPPRPTRTILSPLSRRLVAGLLIAAGILLIIAQLLRVYVLAVSWRGGPSIESAAGVALGLGAGALTSYLGWRIGRAG